MSARRLGGAAFAAVALTVAGCGLAPPGTSNAHVTLLVTRGFGATTLVSGRAAAPHGRETALNLLEAGATVAATPQGSIESINGIRPAGRNRWSYWVNGVQPGVTPGSYVLSPGDAVQFDYGSAPSVTAIVGAYPNPFVRGANGKRVPVHVECESDSSAACQTVRSRLSGAGVIPAAAELGGSAGADTVRVVVARWAAVRSLITTAVVALGPTKSGVFARFDPAGTRLELLDASGNPVAHAPAGSGLVAALAPAQSAVTWLVSGTDESAVDRAASALDARHLRGAFAVAVTPSGVTRLPAAR